MNKCTHVDVFIINIYIPSIKLTNYEREPNLLPARTHSTNTQHPNRYLQKQLLNIFLYHKYNFRRIIQTQQKELPMDRQAIIQLLEVTDEQYSFEPYKGVLSLKNQVPTRYGFNKRNKNRINTENLPIHKIKFQNNKLDCCSREKLKNKLKTIQRDTSPEIDNDSTKQFHRDVECKSLYNIVSAQTSQSESNRYGLRVKKMMSSRQQRQKQNNELRETIKKKFKQKKHNQGVQRLKKINNFLELAKSINKTHIKHRPSQIKKSTIYLGKNIHTLTYLLS